MTFVQFMQSMTEAEKKFHSACTDFPEHAEFLSKCDLVLTRNGSQFPFRKRLSVSDIIERIKLVKDSDFKNNLLSLNKHLKEAQSVARKSQGQEAQRSKDDINRIKEELNSFPLDEIHFYNDFDAQVIFPSVNIGIIQRLKSHPLVNKNKTCGCIACIRVFFY